jgi:hypothetical protein
MRDTGAPRAEQTGPKFPLFGDLTSGEANFLQRAEFTCSPAPQPSLDRLANVSVLTKKGRQSSIPQYDLVLRQQSYPSDMHCMTDSPDTISRRNIFGDEMVDKLPT